MVLERGGVDCKMYLMTSLEMILFYSIHVMFSPISISASQPEPKCHIDLRFQLSHSWGRGCTSVRTKMSHWPQIYTFPFLGEGVYISENQNVTLTSDLHFPIPGVGWGWGWNLRSMWHFSSGWCTPGYIRSHSNFLQVFQSWNENACFWIMFNFWWSAGLVDGLESHLPPLSSQKSEMLIFGLHSTSDDQPSNPSNESQPKCDKRPLSHQKNEILIFINYVQLLMIGQAIRVMKVDQNAKKWHVVSVRVFCCFS